MTSTIELMRVDSSALEVARAMLIDFHERLGLMIHDLEVEITADLVKFTPARVTWTEIQTTSNSAVCETGGTDWIPRLAFHVSPQVRKGWLPTHVVAPSETWFGLLEMKGEEIEEEEPYKAMCVLCVSKLLCESLGKWVANNKKVTRPVT
jgi:hypothetical protein